MRLPRALFRGLLWTSIVTTASTGALAVWVALPIPAHLLDQPRTHTFRLLDRFGVPLRTTRTAGGELHQWIPLEEMEPALLVAFVAAEDRRFYSHLGVDLRALARAAFANLRAGRVVSGASTIPMQLARLLRPLPHSFPGKLAQALWAIRLDTHLSKQTMLEQYLNRVPLGEGAVGVEEAAALYFGRSARTLSLGQAALLAGLAGAPSRDNPLAGPERAAARRTVVLGRMAREGVVSSAESATARAEPVVSPAAAATFLAPHFTAVLVTWLERGGRVAAGDVRTTLDLPLQQALEAEVGHTVETMKRSGVEHAAAVVLHNATGGILAWVGSPDFFAPGNGQVDMVISPRQPGSTLKPFLYGLAFDRGYTAASILPDLPTVYQTGTGPYAPRNYDRRFHGPVRIREALASSFNLPAVELASRLGVGELLAELRRAGFGSLDRDATHYGLGLALGNGDVTLLEVANGYRALANGGVWRPVRWLAGEDGRAGEERRVMSAGAAALVLDVLGDPIARIPGFGPATPLEFSFPAAAKTGTSRHFTDNWAVLVTGGFTVAVWVGNFDGRPMEGVSGVEGAGPLLHRAALLAARRHGPGAFPTPEQAGARPVSICRLSGRRAGSQCPGSTEWFLPGTGPDGDCDWHDASGRVTLPPQYADWASRPDPVTVPGPWVENASTALSRANPAAPPVAATSAFHIVSPSANEVYRFMPGVPPEYSTIGLRTAGAPTSSPVRWFLDGRPLGGTRLRLVPGRHRLRAEAGDLRDEIVFEVKTQ